MIERRGFRIGFATVVLFTVLAGDAWRYSISWYGWGAIVLGITITAVTMLVRVHVKLKQLPYALLAFLVLATASIAWSFYPGASALGVTAQLVTSIAAVGLAITLSWDELLLALGVALRIILGLSLVFELFVSLVIRHAVLPFWVDYGTAKSLPKLLYWSRDVLFTDGKIQGIVGNSSLLAMMALLGLIVFGVQLAAGKTGKAGTTGTVGTISSIIWIVIAALIAAITRSATIFVGVAVCAVVLGAILLLRRTKTSQARVGVSLTLGILAIFAGTVVALFSKEILGLLGKSDSLTGRSGIWEAVIHLAQQRPFFGWGWVSYWAPWVAPFNHLARAGGVQQYHAHNAWLDVWLQLGVLGVLVFAALVLLTVIRSWRLAIARDATLAENPTGDRRSAAFTVLPILILTALIVQSLAESRLIVEYGWLLLVVMAVKTKQSDSNRRSQKAMP